MTHYSSGDNNIWVNQLSFQVLMSVVGFLNFFVGQHTVSLIQPLLELTCRDWQGASKKIFSANSTFNIDSMYSLLPTVCVLLSHVSLIVITSFRLFYLVCFTFNCNS